MKINFEEVVDRNHTGCLKYDGREIFGRGEDQIPLWIADMDLQSPPCVNEAFEARMKHRLYGYNYAPKSYYESIQSWMKRRHGYTVAREEICPFPGVVPALAFLYQAYLKQGDCIMIQEPGYGPFRGIAKRNGYEIINCPLQNINGRFQMNMELMEQQIVEHKVKLFVLCNPHNPVGRVWTKDELEALAALCVKHQVIVISDEIHSDLVFTPNKHIPLPLISQEIKDLCVVCTAPTKTFNLAGLKVSNIIIHNKILREKFLEQCENYDLVSLHTFSYVACESVYTHGEEWLTQLLEHLTGNYDALEACLKEFPDVTFQRPEATYLAWIDVTDMGYDLPTLKQKFEEHHLWVEFQDEFGEQSDRLYVRINVAISRTRLEEVLHHLRQVLTKENTNE